VDSHAWPSLRATPASVCSSPPVTNSDKGVLGTILHPEYCTREFGSVSHLRDSREVPIALHILCPSFLFCFYYFFNPPVETQGSWGRALVVVLADGAIISSCGQHVVTSPRFLYMPFNTIGAPELVDIAQLPQQVRPSATAFHQFSLNGSCHLATPSSSQPCRPARDDHRCPHPPSSTDDVAAVSVW